MQSKTEFKYRNYTITHYRPDIEYFKILKGLLDHAIDHNKKTDGVHKTMMSMEDFKMMETWFALQPEGKQDGT